MDGGGGLTRAVAMSPHAGSAALSYEDARSRRHVSAAQGAGPLQLG